MMRGCSLNHDEVQVRNGETLIALNSNTCHVLELGDSLNASEATTNNDEGQGHDDVPQHH